MNGIIDELYNQAFYLKCFGYPPEVIEMPPGRWQDLLNEGSKEMLRGGSVKPPALGVLLDLPVFPSQNTQVLGLKDGKLFKVCIECDHHVIPYKDRVCWECSHSTNW